MSFYDNMVERFETPLGVLGFNSNGRLRAAKYPNVDRGFCPVWDGITATENPSQFAIWFRQAATGDQSLIGKNVGMNDQGLEITATGVHAEINVGMETYEQELTFAEFAPILEVWEKAWAAAQVYKATLPAS